MPAPPAGSRAHAGEEEEEEKAPFRFHSLSPPPPLGLCPPPPWCRIALKPTMKSRTPRTTCFGLIEILRRWKKGGGGRGLLPPRGLPLPPATPLSFARPLVVAGGDTERGRIFFRGRGTTACATMGELSLYKCAVLLFFFISVGLKEELGGRVSRQRERERERGQRRRRGRATVDLSLVC